MIKTRCTQKNIMFCNVIIIKDSLTEKITVDLDRSKIYIVYCDGIGSNASTKGALNLAKLGSLVKEIPEDKISLSRWTISKKVTGYNTGYLNSSPGETKHYRYNF